MSKQNPHLEPSFTTLILSIGSSAAMGMGLAPHPTTQKTEVDLPMARFQIDMLMLLRDKTKNNLDDTEKTFLDQVINDLQKEFVKIK